MEMRMAQLPKVLKNEETLTTTMASIQNDINKENHNQYIQKQELSSKERPLF
jgi:hypothetical protein